MNEERTYRANPMTDCGHVSVIIQQMLIEIPIEYIKFKDIALF
jgi:hypothetical protein